jgi:hypothetical protein
MTGSHLAPNCKKCATPMRPVETKPDFRCFECPACSFVMIESVRRSSGGRTSGPPRPNDGDDELGDTHDVRLSACECDGAVTESLGNVTRADASAG